MLYHKQTQPKFRRFQRRAEPAFAYDQDSVTARPTVLPHHGIILDESVYAALDADPDPDLLWTVTVCQFTFVFKGRRFAGLMTNRAQHAAGIVFVCDWVTAEREAMSA